MNDHTDPFIPRDKRSIPLRTPGGQTFRHLFQIEDIDAINTAIACTRPLLLTGEPGVGKTQLARAAAKATGRALVRYTVDAKTESRDLLWHSDAVARLADAQVAEARDWSQSELEKKLASHNYLRPGPLWWAFDWATAKMLQKAITPAQDDGGDPRSGVVVLIDEIDKAEIDVPNGLLEAMGDGSFQPEGWSGRVRMGSVAPLVVITTNRERTLPAAFLRRCLAWRLALPEDEGQLREVLVKRGQAHSELDQELVLGKDADMLIEDRTAAKDRSARPGLAEYLDLLRAVEELAKRSGEKPERLLERARPYLLRKGSAF